MEFAIELSLFVGFSYLCINQIIHVKSDQALVIYNSLSGKKETFIPLHEGHVGMYVCGPTVYDDPHIGNARPIVIFDILFKVLKNKFSSVNYVRNITDAGHLENDSDNGEDRSLLQSNRVSIFR